jgi:hypothetical protein
MVHENSASSYDMRGPEYDRIVETIRQYYEANKHRAFTDRQISEEMCSRGLITDTDMNMVRPKITLLKKRGFIEELPEKFLDLKTDRRVRLCQWSGMRKPAIADPDMFSAAVPE